MTSSSNFGFLPSDIENHEKTLVKSREHVHSLSKMSDGMFLNSIGLDAILGAIPIVGGLYTAGAGVWMVVLAKRVNAPLQDMLLLSFLIVVDVVMGIWPILGDIPDAFFRVHGWYGSKLIEHIDEKLSLIKEARDQAVSGLSVDFDILRNVVLGKAIPVSSSSNTDNSK